MPSRAQFLRVAKALGTAWKEHLDPRLGVRRAHPFLSISELMEVPGVAEAVGPGRKWKSIDGDAFTTPEDLLADMVGQASCFPVPWCSSDGNAYHEATEVGCFTKPDLHTMALSVPGVMMCLTFTDPWGSGEKRRLFLGTTPEIQTDGDAEDVRSLLGVQDLAVMVCHYVGECWTVSLEAAHCNDCESDVFTESGFGYVDRSKLGWTAEDMIRTFAYVLAEDREGSLPPWSGDLGPFRNKRKVIGWHAVPRLLRWFQGVPGWSVVVEEVPALSSEILPIRGVNPETGEFGWLPEKKVTR